ncbi:MAG TPA: HAMP domain-containing sensor histidine kinase [Aggregatilineaceae bacterium]|nr:HAMP domain-containing sensor histidine kinase [Aggregatilineaceae bacterium]
MNVRSIRWQLPLSYAAIACLAAVALGIVLLTTLRNYYDQKEREYLARNAVAISADISPMLKSPLVPGMLNEHAQTLSFFAQARIRILNSDEQLLGDSGERREKNWLSIYYSQPVVQPLWNVTSTSPNIIREVFTEEGDSYSVSAGGGNIRVSQPARMEGDSVVYVENSIPPTTTTIEFKGEQSGLFVSAMPATGTLYGFDLSDQAELETKVIRYSDQEVRHELRDENGGLLGYIVLSDGPAYGTEIVTSVAHGWFMASGVAMLLAVIAGWFVSQRISKPLLVLTQVTSQMSEGNLSARVNLKQRNELGMLAASYNEMAGRIEETITTLKRFVADAAHELHTPITALRTNLEIVGDIDDPALRRAQEQVIRLETLTDDLLDLSRLEAHVDRAEHKPINMVALIEEINEIYASRAEQADIEFMVEMPNEVPLISGNQQQLERMMSNLVDNAIKFTPTGGTVKVRVGQEARHLAVAVCDNGIGIPADDLPRLFERFRRGRNSANYAGSGLGLAIVRAVVQAHHGQVTATSQPGETCIQVKLPY